MFHRFDNRAGHHALLVATWAALCLPNLGGPSLWDIDEGNNATAALEMSESGDWVVPKFNTQLRLDKPALLYWLEASAYAFLGVNEFAARLPSALAALISILATYELGRRLFAPSAGLLAGLMLASAVLFCASAHFANPDALLNACTVLTLLCFFCHYQGGASGCLVATGVTTGLGMLAKGPVALVLPSAVIFLFLLLRWQLRRFFHPALVLAALAFLLVAGPWYVWVGVETKGEWLYGFFIKHNIDRYWETMESHGGPFFYYLLVLCVGFAPWSVFFALSGWYAAKQWWAGGRARTAEGGQQRDAIQYLVCWIGVYLVFFSASSTKLPNYILPLYPAVALLTALFLDHWRRGLVQPPVWTIQASLVGLVLMGAGVGVGLLIVGGGIQLPPIRDRQLPGLEVWASAGLLLALGGVVGWWALHCQRRGALIATTALTALLFTGALAAWGGDAVDRYKAPRALVQAMPADQTQREVRVAAYVYFQPSLVFYCQREVACLKADYEALEFLRGPLPSYLFVPASVWEELQAKVKGPHRVVARHHDLYDGCDVVLVTNE